MKAIANTVKASNRVSKAKADKPKEEDTAPTETWNIVTCEEVEAAIGRLRGWLLRKFGSCEAVMQKLDKNEDNMLSFEEFQSSMVEHSVPVAELLADVTQKRLFTTLDVDGTGDLCLDEFMCSNPREQEEEAVVALRQFLMSRFRTKNELFNALDEDNNGSVSLSELERALAVYGINTMEVTKGMELARIFDFLDIDCSGGLSLCELLEGEPRKLAAERDNAIRGVREKILTQWGSKEAAMKAFDLNGNGSLSYGELKGGFERANISTTRFCGGNRDLRWFFKVLDVDGSGEISSKELFEEDPAQEGLRFVQARRKKAAQREVEKVKRQKQATMKADKLMGKDKPTTPGGSPIKTSTSASRLTGKEAKKLEEERQAAETLIESLGGNARQVSDKYEKLERRYRRVCSELDGLRTDYRRLHKDHAELNDVHTRLLEECSHSPAGLLNDFRKLQQDHATTLAETHELQETHTRLVAEHAVLNEKHKKIRVGLVDGWDGLSTTSSITAGPALTTATPDKVMPTRTMKRPATVACFRTADSNKMTSLMEGADLGAGLTHHMSSLPKDLDSFPEDRRSEIQDWDALSFLETIEERSGEHACPEDNVRSVAPGRQCLSSSFPGVAETKPPARTRPYTSVPWANDNSNNGVRESRLPSIIEDRPNTGTGLRIASIRGRMQYIENETDSFWKALRGE